MEFKGTSGKWKVITTSETENKTLFVTSETHGAICQIPDRFKAIQEHEANAKLISKAPELLEELKHLVRALEVVSSMGAAKPIIESAKKLIKEATTI